MMLLSALLLIILASCTTLPKHPQEDNRVAFTVRGGETLLSRHAPVFVIENPGASHNLIGTPGATLTPGDKETIYTDPSRATVYAEERPFTTPKGSYTNLIYRVHFENIPGGFMPYYLGKGKNVGLLVVVTLNSGHEPMLYTTVHTCGCYLAFVPTSYLPEDSFPDGWKRGRQAVHSENLPGYLTHNASSPNQGKTMVLLRNDTHRVKDIWRVDTDSLPDYRRIHAEVLPLSSLESLPLERGGTTSFYETSGPRTGYVKGSQKSRERLFMSWWAFDWRIGEDKKLGVTKEDGVQFYTSLKPWARDASDMRDFPAFLRHWGWNL
ncbi:hypothetical protein DSLASN_23560 [Desulfoluna limicola]|uniref:Lipoprotein n=2 Tax=Desulfoluna limicola TaxID=2810562 RepID=A0ABN6F2K7_9BACT|nr:hypothetical protein DSLASN_23560 [Desulfoluna limicola]